MGSGSRWLIPLTEAVAQGEAKVGAKALRLAELGQAGFRVPRGFCLPVACYERFVRENKLDLKIELELGRKPLSSMRWEELWDTAHRIRAGFLAGTVPAVVSVAVRQAVDTLGSTRLLAVRSSAPGEDRGEMSFAGLHDSVVGSTGISAVLDAVRIVWASLCVNGSEDSLGRLTEGEPVTVDGHLGIVTIGPPDFALQGVTLV